MLCGAFEKVTHTVHVTSRMNFCSATILSLIHFHVTTSFESEPRFRRSVKSMNGKPKTQHGTELAWQM